MAVVAIAYSQESIYVQGDNNTGVLPLPEIHWRNYYFADGKLGLTFFNNEELALDFYISPDILGDTDRGDSKLLKDMSKLDTVINANLSASYGSELGDFSINLAQDISNTHDGFSISAGYSYNFNFGQFFVEPSLSITYSDKGVADYYYGVNQSEVTASRPQYEIDSTINTDLQLATGYMINERSTLLAYVNYTIFDSEIEKSPIVESDSAVIYGIGYRYQF